VAPALWLFDIDGTLIDSGGAGLRSLREAAAHCFGGDGPDLDLAGSTDLGVVAGIFRHFEREESPDGHSAFFAHYLERLDANLASAQFPGRALPGALELLEHLSRQPDVTLGLLTGNTAEGAAIKMRHFGMDRFFAFGAYGSDYADRNLLGPIALARAAQYAGRPFTAAETVVIGDTPKDIACAQAMGARCIAVATGSFTREQLLAYGADQVIGSLEELLSGAYSAM